MRHACLLLLMALCQHVPTVLMDCRVIQTVKDIPNYRCTIQELRDKGDANMTVMFVYDDESLPWLNSTTLQKVPNLVYLEIKNSISGIKLGTFDLLRDLKQIVISRNSYFETVTNGTFMNIPVELISLSDNWISIIEPGAFSNVTNLRTLRLGNNNLQRIKSGMFDGLPVEVLTLSKNRISVLEKNAFVNMQKLKRLHLDGNFLTKFEPDFLMNYGQVLEILWLHNNSFTRIDQYTVKGLNKLKLLNLQDNNIAEILLYTFNELPNLEVLVLSNNSLVNFNADIFPKAGMANLVKLYLDNNRLSFLTTKVLGRLKDLESIRIGGNPWQCSCLETIDTWLADHEIRQPCDKDYYDGSRPICVLTDENPNKCIYFNDLQYYSTYKNAIDNLPDPVPVLCNKTYLNKKS